MCDFKSCTKVGLQKHFRKFHYESLKYKCHNCSERYNSEKSLQYHWNKRRACKPKITGEIPLESEKKTEFEKVYYVLPRPKKGKWIVPLQRIENIHTMFYE